MKYKWAKDKSATTNHLEGEKQQPNSAAKSTKKQQENRGNNHRMALNTLNTLNTCSLALRVYLPYPWRKLVAIKAITGTATTTQL